MARQIIDIGVQGNDGTGDSIRESFRKVNDNFTQLFAIFGAGDRIAFTDLDDTPSSYGAKQLVVANDDGDRLITKSLIAGRFITIDDTDPNQITISAETGSLSGDLLPTLSRPLNSGGWALGNLSDPDTGLAAYNNTFATNPLPDASSFAVTKGYGDIRYFRPSAGRSTTDVEVRIKDEPVSSSEYVKTISDWSGGYANIPSHGYTEDINGTAVVYTRTGTTDATGLLSNGTVYYIRYQDANNLAIYPTKQDALEGTSLNRIIVNSSPVIPSASRGIETLADAGWDSTLSGNWLSDEALPRKSAVRRQGDTMTGFLTLSADPTGNLHAATKQYVDAAKTAAQTYAAGYYTGGTGVTISSGTVSIGQAVATTSNVTFNNLTVNGNLTVSGTTTTVNTATLDVADNFITLNSNVTGVPALNAGLEIERGSSENTFIKWNEPTDKWQQTRDGTTYYDIPISTDELAEGTTNKYFSNTLSYAKTKAVLKAGAKIQLTANDVAETITISVTGGTGGFDLSSNTTDDLAEGTTNKYYLDSRARGAVSATNTGTGYGTLSYDSGTGAFSFAKVTAANIRGTVSSANSGTGYGSLSYDSGTGTFTFAKVTDTDIRGALSAGTGITYNSSTGAISSSITQYTDTNARAALSSGTGISYNSTSGVISSSITQYTDSAARGAVSATNSGTGYGSLGYDSGTGVFTFTKVTNTDIRSAISAGTGITISNGQISSSITQYTDSAARAAVSATNSGTGYGSLGYDSGTGVFTFTKVTNTDIRSAISAGTDIAISNGQISVSSSTTATNDSIAKRTSTGELAASTFKGSTLTTVQSLIISTPPGNPSLTLTNSQITGNILTVAITNNATLSLPSAANGVGRILIIRNQSVTNNLVVDDGSTNIVTLTPAAPIAQIFSDGDQWFVL